jgi:hypothetical protein
MTKEIVGKMLGRRCSLCNKVLKHNRPSTFCGPKCEKRMYNKRLTEKWNNAN